METRTLTPFLAVSGQVDAGDIGSLAARGFHTIINNRPDDEGDGQPSSDELEQAARPHAPAPHRSTADFAGPVVR